MKKKTSYNATLFEGNYALICIDSNTKHNLIKFAKQKIIEHGNKKYIYRLGRIYKYEKKMTKLKDIKF